MILFKHKIDILEFFDLVDSCDYPRKAKELREYTADWNSTYSIFKKGITRDQSRNIKEILGNLEEITTEVFDKNRLGKIDSWELYVVYLETVDGKTVISFLENTKTKRAMSFSKDI